eukprot:31314-Pelagococcus_subviridis.AAC.3
MPSTIARNASVAAVLQLRSLNARTIVVSKNACSMFPPSPPHSASAACSAPNRGNPAGECFFSLLLIHAATSPRHALTASAQSARAADDAASGTRAPATGASTAVNSAHSACRKSDFLCAGDHAVGLRCRSTVAADRSPLSAACVPKNPSRRVAVDGPGAAPSKDTYRYLAPWMIACASARFDSAGALGSSSRAARSAAAAGSCRDARPRHLAASSETGGDGTRSTGAAASWEPLPDKEAPAASASASRAPPASGRPPHCSHGGVVAFGRFALASSASNAASSIGATSPGGSAPGGNGARMRCIACQNASESVFEAQDTSRPLPETSARCCCSRHRASARVRWDAPVGASAASAGRKSLSAARPAFLSCPSPGPCVGRRRGRGGGSGRNSFARRRRHDDEARGCPCGGGREEGSVLASGRERAGSRRTAFRIATTLFVYLARSASVRSMLPAPARRATPARPTLTRVLRFPAPSASGRTETRTRARELSLAIARRESFDHGPSAAAEAADALAARRRRRPHRQGRHDPRRQAQGEPRRRAVRPPGREARVERDVGGVRAKGGPGGDRDRPEGSGGVRAHVRGGHRRG